MISQKSQVLEDIDREEKGEDYLGWHKTDGGFQESGLGRGFRYRKSRKCATRAFTLALEKVYPDLSRSELYRNLFDKLQAMDPPCRKETDELWADHPETSRGLQKTRDLLARIVHGQSGPAWATCIELALRQGFKVLHLKEPVTWSTAHRIWGNCIVESHGKDHLAWIADGQVHDMWDSRYLDPSFRKTLLARRQNYRCAPNLTRQVFVPPACVANESLKATDIQNDLQRFPPPKELDYSGETLQIENYLWELRFREDSRGKNPGVSKDPNFVVPKFLKREISQEDAED